jgi:hypothetical protein
MVDRQDIDALLIGSLYGELSSTEEARLAAHLESHPADRTALADLTRARAVVRESRILQVQFEPPQSISALLMQEAVRRAPKRREEMNWFQRFMRSVLLHPAMAAAAMLVLIIGVAGTMYLKQGDQYAGPKKSPEITTSKSAGDQTAMLPPPTTADAPTVAPTEQYQVALDDGAGGKMADRSEDEQSKSLADKRKQVAAAETKKAQLESQLAMESRRREVAKNEKALAKESPAPKNEPPKAAEEQPVAKSAPKAKPSKGYIEVTTPDQRPKDFEGNATVAGRGDASKQDSVASNRPGGGSVPKAPATGSTVPTTPMPSPPPPPAENKPAEAKPDPMLAWAKEQHGKAIAAAKKDCKLAASIVTQISNRAPAYYSANIENDRALKSCQQYIAQEREKELERANRAKATQKRAVDEAPAPAPTTTK